MSDQRGSDTNGILPGVAISEESRRKLDDLTRTRTDYDHEDDQDEPFFVADLGEIYRQHQRWERRLPNVRPFDAVKCNPDPEVLRLLALLGTGFDCSSRNEMQMVLDLDVTPDRIIYAQPNKHHSHLRFARRHGIRKMTFDGVDELHKIKEIYPEPQLLLRIITDDSSSRCQFSAKFGAPMSTTQSLLEVARAFELDVVGVSFHIGSAAVNPGLFIQAARDSQAVFEQALDYGFKLTFLDVGGGFSDESFDIMSRTLSETLSASFPGGVRFLAEPGRYLVSTAFTVACLIIARREIVSEDGMPHYTLTLNDGVYGSFMDCLLSHWQRQPQILRCASGERRDQGIRYTIWGPTCDGVDLVVKDAFLDHLLSVGDWVYFSGMGAYSLCLSTSFNGFSNVRRVHYTSSDPAARELLGYRFRIPFVMAILEGFLLTSIWLSFWVPIPTFYRRNRLHSGPLRYYSDEDGESTQETLDVFRRRSHRQIVALLIVNFVGLGVNSAAAVTIPRNRMDVYGRPGMHGIALWILAAFLLASQGLVIAHTASPIDRQDQGIITGLCGILVYSANIGYDLHKNHKGHMSSVRLGFCFAHLALLVTSASICFTLPRRPSLFRNGHGSKAIDGERTVSVISRITLSWANSSFSHALRHGGLDFQDLYHLRSRMSAQALVSSFKSIKSDRRRLWVTIVLCHGSALSWQCLLTLLRSFAILAPQYIMYRLILIVEAKSMRPVPEATGWLALLGLAQLSYPWIEAWCLWVGWCHIALPVNVQLSGLVIAKAMRKIDTNATVDSRSDNHQQTPAGSVEAENESDGSTRSTGEVEANLISVDVQRVSDFLSYNSMSVQESLL
ncbi:MAG: hypothetical protein Q9222_004170 [Ikaeria aurantiellina]